MGARFRDPDDSGSAVGCRLLHFVGHVPGSEAGRVDHCGGSGHDDGRLPDDAIAAISETMEKEGLA